jgi:hypothetical protein
MDDALRTVFVPQRDRDRLGRRRDDDAAHFILLRLVPPARIERATLPLGGGCSIH